MVYYAAAQSKGALQPLQGSAVDVAAGLSAATLIHPPCVLLLPQLEDIPAGAAPSILPPAAAATPGAPAAAAVPAEAPTVAADQHTIDVSIKRAQYNSYDDAEAPWVQHLSWHPRLHLHHNFLTPEECDKMKELLARPSGVVGGSNAGAESAADEEASLMLMLDIEHRVANWTALPPNHLEGWQVILSSQQRHAQTVLAAAAGLEPSMRWTIDSDWISQHDGQHDGAQLVSNRECWPCSIDNWQLCL